MHTSFLMATASMTWLARGSRILTGGNCGSVIGSPVPVGERDLSALLALHRGLGCVEPGGVEGLAGRAAQPEQEMHQPIRVPTGLVFGPGLGPGLAGRVGRGRRSVLGRLL